MESTIKLYLKAKHGDNYTDEIFTKLALTPGAGASGGIVAAFMSTFTKAKLINGMDYISSLINLEQQIADSSVVFTGEGSFDSQTLEGKLVCKVHQLC